MKPGERETWYCNGCVRRFAVHYEPQITPRSDAAKTGPVGRVQFCPFCGTSAGELEKES